MQGLWQAISHTPLWVWPLLALLIFLGARAVRTRIVAVRQVWIMAAVMMGISWISVFTSPAGPALGLGYWLAGAAIGAPAGWMLARSVALQADHAHGLVRLPGSFVPLLLYVSVFLIRYAFGYAFARYPELTADAKAVALSSATSGLIGGMFLVRQIVLYRTYRAAGSVNLA